MFSHNDLLSGNIVYDKKNSIIKLKLLDSVAFIDYEYASYNYRGATRSHAFGNCGAFIMAIRRASESLKPLPTNLPASQSGCLHLLSKSVDARGRFPRGATSAA